MQTFKSLWEKEGRKNVAVADEREAIKRGNFYCSIYIEQKNLYRSNLKNRFLAASALPQNFRSHSCLASRQWSLAPNKNFEEPLCQIPDS
jgi:hypothetical protein